MHIQLFGWHRISTGLSHAHWHHSHSQKQVNVHQQQYSLSHRRFSLSFISIGFVRVQRGLSYQPSKHWFINKPPSLPYILLSTVHLMSIYTHPSILSWLVHPSICVLTSLSVSPSPNSSIQSCIHPFIHMSMYLSVHSFTHPSIHPCPVEYFLNKNCLTISPSFHVSIYLSVCLPSLLHPFMYLSISLPTNWNEQYICFYTAIQILHNMALILLF